MRNEFHSLFQRVLGKSVNRKDLKLIDKFLVDYLGMNVLCSSKSLWFLIVGLQMMLPALQLIRASPRSCLKSSMEIALSPQNQSTADRFSFSSCYHSHCVDVVVQVELRPGGRHIHLSLSNCKEFVDLMLAYVSLTPLTIVFTYCFESLCRYHFSEFDVQCAAIAQGLSTQVCWEHTTGSQSFMNVIFAPFLGSVEYSPNFHSCSIRVDGDRAKWSWPRAPQEVDLDFFMFISKLAYLLCVFSKTTYESPYTENHPTIILFWKMMEQFSHVNIIN